MKDVTFGMVWGRPDTLRAKTSGCAAFILLTATIFSCTGTSNAPSFANGEDAIAAYRSFLGEVRTIDKMDCRRLSDKICGWRVLSDSVNACLSRDSSSVTHSNDVSVCWGILESLRVEFKRLALSQPRTFHDALYLLEHTAPSHNDPNMAKVADFAAQFYAVVDSMPDYAGDRTTLLNSYKQFLLNTKNNGIKDRNDVLTFLAEEDRYLRGYLKLFANFTDQGAEEAKLTTDISQLTEDCCNEVYNLTADAGGFPWETVTLMSNRASRRLIQNAQVCAEDVLSEKILGAEQAIVYKWMVIRPYSSITGLSMSMMPAKTKEDFYHLAVITPTVLAKLDKVAGISADADTDLVSLIIGQIIDSL